MTRSPVRRSGSSVRITITVSFLLAVLASVLFLCTSPSEGHAPSDMELEYDYGSQVLSVTITHTTPAPSSHYVETVDVYRNDILVLEEHYDSQPDPRTFTYEYEVTAVDGDILRVHAECSIQGSIEDEITVEGPREYMYLSVNPTPEEVEMGSELDLTVNIYAEEDDMPLDGVSVIPRVDLGLVSEVSELGLGGYAFTYSAPDLESEDIEVLNLSCTKNGYHPLYFEISFDLVLSIDDSRKIEIAMDPWIYGIDEGETREINVVVTAGGEPLDIGTLDVDYSKGSLDVEKIGVGMFRLTYEAAHVDADTSAFIRVSASMIGYRSDERRMEFVIRDTGSTGEEPADGGGPAPYTWGLVALAAGAILVTASLVFLIYSKRKGRGPPGEKRGGRVYEAVEVEEVQEDS